MNIHESKANTPEQAIESYPDEKATETAAIMRLARIATAVSLISQAIGFSVFGTLIMANRHQADLNDFADGNLATMGGISAILVGTAFLIAACLYWRFCTRRSATLAVSRKTARLTFPKRGYDFREGPNRAVEVSQMILIGDAHTPVRNSPDIGLSGGCSIFSEALILITDEADRCLQT